VIAAAGSDSKLEIAKRFGGADYLVNYSKPGWQKTVLEITNKKGVDIIYDPVGLVKGTYDCLTTRS
jgi:NADPH2:quinone reductase